MMHPDRPDRQPADGKPPQDAARDQRRADALRANLKRRKAQLRGRASREPADEADAPPRPIESP